MEITCGQQYLFRYLSYFLRNFVQTAVTTGDAVSDVNILNIAVFSCPRRPNLGREGRPIGLRANHFQISMPRGFVHHYDINIQPDKCPRKVNREIIETMVHAYSKIFGTLKPVFDGRNNLYTRDPLPIGNDRVELEVEYLLVCDIL
jgi:eukaryotic translation initiation factor 2C